MECMTATEGRFVLQGILALSGKEKIEASTPCLHETIYQLSIMDAFRDLLGSYIFQDRGKYHYSRRLEIDFRNLELAFMLSNQNPSLSKYTINSNAKEKFEKYTKSKFSADDIPILEAMASKFADLI